MLKVFDQTKEWPSKTNFIDSNNCMLGFDREQDCCEDHDWCVSDDPEKWGEGNKTIPDINGGWEFDTQYRYEYGPEEEDNRAAFRIVPSWVHSNQDTAPLYIILRNRHNGYYSHGFFFSTPTYEGSL